MKKSIISVLLIVFLISCKSIDKAIEGLSSSKSEEATQASELLINKSHGIQKKHLPAIEARLNMIQDEKIIYNIFKALAGFKSKKICDLYLRFLSKRNYDIKDEKLLWIMIEKFVEIGDDRILTVMPVGLRFNKKNYKAFSWAYGEFAKIKYFKDLYTIYISTPSGEIRNYLRISLNKILKENGVHIPGKKHMEMLLEMLRTTWDYIPGTGRSAGDEINSGASADGRNGNTGQNRGQNVVDELNRAFSENNRAGTPSGSRRPAQSQRTDNSGSRNSRR